jgi:hypothetical protein
MVTVDSRSLAPRVRYVLYLVHPDDTEKLVSEHSDFQSGWLAGTHVVTVEDQENAYSLYGRGRRVARFGHSRLMPRFGTERLPSLAGLL